MSVLCLMVETGAEIETAGRICRRFKAEGRDGLVSVGAPKRVMLEKRGKKWVRQMRVMMPGYLFAGMPDDLPAAEWAREYTIIRETDGVLRIVGAVDDADRKRLEMLDNGGQPWGISHAVAQGDGLVIVSGPLVKYSKYITRVDRHRRRATLEMDIAGVRQKIDVALVIEKPDFII